MGGERGRGDLCRKCIGRVPDFALARAESFWENVAWLEYGKRWRDWKDFSAEEEVV